MTLNPAAGVRQSLDATVTLTDRVVKRARTSIGVP